MENAKPVNLRFAPKRNRRRRLYGMKLEFLVARWLAKDFGWGDDILLDMIGRVDVHVLGGRKVELECKRFNLTKYVGLSWLKTNVVERYSKDAWLKVLVVTKKCWDADCEKFLAANNIKVLEVGDVNGKEQINEAEKKFVDGFTKLYVDRLMEEEEVCREKLSR